MQQWWFEAKISFFMIFVWFFPNLKVFINIHEYKNKIICIFDHGTKVLQSFVPFIYLLDMT